MRKPRIALTPRYSNENLRQGDNTEYLDAIIQCGGVPYIIALGTDIKEILHDFDGLLVTGGEDIAPELYGEKVEYDIECAPLELDEYEMDLIHAFDDAGKPIFGICRGIQSINVAFGGTLFQDLKSQVADCRSQGHQQHLVVPKPARNDVFHEVEILPNTFLSTLMSKQNSVNSYHHQAIKDLANGFKVSALSEDGIIEAFEKSPRLFAVQWHPERLTHLDEEKALFEAFINECQTMLLD